MQLKLIVYYVTVDARKNVLASMEKRLSLKTIRYTLILRTESNYPLLATYF